MVPSGGFIRIYFPFDVTFDSEKIVELDSCLPTTTTCTYVEKKDSNEKITERYV